MLAEEMAVENEAAALYVAGGGVAACECYSSAGWCVHDRGERRVVEVTPNTQQMSGPPCVLCGVRVVGGGHGGGGKNCQ